MSTVAIILTVFTGLIFLLDLFFPIKYKQKIKYEAINTWVSLSERNFSEIAFEATTKTHKFFSRQFGAHFKSKIFYTRILKYNFYLFSFLVVLFSTFSIFAYLIHFEFSIPLFNEMFRSFDTTVSEDRSRAAYIVSYQFVEILSTSILGFIISSIFCIISLGITMIILEKISLNNIFYMVFIDFIIAAVASNISLMVLILFRAGYIVDFEYIKMIVNIIFNLFPQAMEDYIVRDLEIVIEFHRWDFRTDWISVYFDEWKYFFGSINGFLTRSELVGPSQTVWNWIIIISFLPTFSHMLYTLTLYVFVQSEPVLRKPLLVTLEWLSDHPKAPIALISAIAVLFIIVVDLWLLK